ncbi:MAG: Mrp/NBP35 family ATP-binding protein [Candidatus Eremiobacterota bacterium]
MDQQCKTCNFQEGCSHIGHPDDRCMEEIIRKDRLNKIGKKLLVMSGKGGVGKTSVAVNLAIALTMAGKKVGLLDIDIHGPNIPKMLGLEGKRLAEPSGELSPLFIPPSLKVMSIGFLLERSKEAVIWRGPLKMRIIDQFLTEVTWGELDYLLIDAPPGTGDEPLTIAQLIPGAEAIIVTTGQEVSILDVSKSITFCQRTSMKIAGIIENMSGFSCPHCGQEINLFKTGGGEKLAMDEGIRFLGRIPIDPEIVNCGDSGKAYVKEYPHTKGSDVFKKIAIELGVE